jgi:hypothetical protein
MPQPDPPEMPEQTPMAPPVKPEEVGTNMFRKLYKKNSRVATMASLKNRYGSGGA